MSPEYLGRAEYGIGGFAATAQPKLTLRTKLACARSLPGGGEGREVASSTDAQNSREVAREHRVQTRSTHETIRCGGRCTQDLGPGRRRAASAKRAAGTAARDSESANSSDTPVPERGFAEAARIALPG